MATSLAAIGIIAVAGTVSYAFHGELKPGAAMLVGLPAAVGVRWSPLPEDEPGSRCNGSHQDPYSPKARTGRPVDPSAALSRQKNRGQPDVLGGPSEAVEPADDDIDQSRMPDVKAEEGRTRLTEREKDFNLRYVILVAAKDLEKAGAKPKPAAQESSPPARSEPVVTAAPTEPADSAPVPRKTLAEIEAAEEAELLRRATQKDEG